MMKTKIKIFIFKTLYVLILVGLTIGVFCFYEYRKGQTNDIQVEAGNKLKESVTVSWLNSFLAHDYYTCDLLSSDKIITNNYSDYTYSSDSIIGVIDGLVSCISDISVSNIKEGKYKVVVTLKPYVKAEEISIDKDYITNIGKKYVNGELYSSELDSELKEIYTDAFKNTVFSEGTEELVISLELDEAGKEDIKVVNTKDFITALLENSNIMYNLKFYEDNVRTEIEKYLVEENRG